MGKENIEHGKRAVLFDLLEVIGFPSVPVLVGYRLAVRHPEKSTFLSLVSSRGPEVFEPQT